MDDGKYGEGTEGAAVQRLSTDGAAAEEARETVCSSVESCAALLGCAKLARVTYPSDRYDIRRGQRDIGAAAAKCSTFADISRASYIQCCQLVHTLMGRRGLLRASHFQCTVWRA